MASKKKYKAIEKRTIGVIKLGYINECIKLKKKTTVLKYKKLNLRKNFTVKGIKHNKSFIIAKFLTKNSSFIKKTTIKTDAK
jgi:hypothetical protein